MAEVLRLLGLRSMNKSIWSVDEITHNEFADKGNSIYDRNALKVLAYAERFRILGIRFRSAPRWSVYRRNSEINLTAPQLPEIEAIQISLFVDVPDVLVIDRFYSKCLNVEVKIYL